MRNERRVERGMGLRGADTSLRPPPPLHFLFHFLLLMPPLCPFHFCQPYLFFIEVNATLTCTHQCSGRQSAIMISHVLANQLLILSQLINLHINFDPFPGHEVCFYFLPSRKPWKSRNLIAITKTFINYLATSSSFSSVFIVGQHSTVLFSSSIPRCDYAQWFHLRMFIAK